MNIDIKEYLSQEEIKCIVIQEFRSHIQQHFKKESDMQRILTNTAYLTIYKELNEITDNQAERIIKDKLNELLQKPLYFGEVFKCKDVWDKDESKAFKILMNTVEENKQLLSEKVKDCIHNLPKTDIQPTIKEAVLKKISKMFE